MLGTPTGWRDLGRDALRDPALHDVLKLADEGEAEEDGEFHAAGRIPMRETAGYFIGCSLSRSAAL